MSATKLLAVLAIAATAFAASSAAQAGLGVPQKPTAAALASAEFAPGPGK